MTSKRDRIWVLSKWVFDDTATKITPIFSKWTGTISAGWKQKRDKK